MGRYNANQKSNLLTKLSSRNCLKLVKRTYYDLPSDGALKKVLNATYPCAYKDKKLLDDMLRDIDQGSQNKCTDFTHFNFAGKALDLRSQHPNLHSLKTVLSLSNLKHFKLGPTTKHQEEHISKGLANLEKMKSLELYQSETCEFVQVMVKKSINVNAVCINACKSLDANLFQALLNVSTLSLRNCELNSGDLDSICDLINLEELDISQKLCMHSYSYDKPQQALFFVLYSLSNLKSLNISGTNLALFEQGMLNEKLFAKLKSENKTFEAIIAISVTPSLTLKKIPSILTLGLNTEQQIINVLKSPLVNYENFPFFSSLFQPDSCNIGQFDVSTSIMFYELYLIAYASFLANDKLFKCSKDIVPKHFNFVCQTIKVICSSISNARQLSSIAKNDLTGQLEVLYYNLLEQTGELDSLSITLLELMCRKLNAENPEHICLVFHMFDHTMKWKIKQLNDNASDFFGLCLAFCIKHKVVLVSRIDRITLMFLDFIIKFKDNYLTSRYTFCAIMRIGSQFLMEGQTYCLKSYRAYIQYILFEIVSKGYFHREFVTEVVLLFKLVLESEQLKLSELSSNLQFVKNVKMLVEDVNKKYEQYSNISRTTDKMLGMLDKCR
jgi:hypothetical protein